MHDHTSHAPHVRHICAALAIDVHAVSIGAKLAVVHKKLVHRPRKHERLGGQGLGVAQGVLGKRLHVRLAEPRLFLTLLANT